MWITEREDILDTLHWLAGQKIRVTAGGGKPSEFQVERVIDTHLPSADGILEKEGLKIVTVDGKTIPLEIPKQIQETPTGFILDFNEYGPSRIKDPGEIAEEDREALETISRGRIERVTKAGGKKRHKVLIEVL